MTVTTGVVEEAISISKKFRIVTNLQRRLGWPPLLPLKKTQTSRRGKRTPRSQERRVREDNLVQADVAVSHRVHILPEAMTCTP